MMDVEQREVEQPLLSEEQEDEEKRTFDGADIGTANNTDNAPEYSMESETNFSALGLDARLTKALNRNGFVIPTQIQEKCIPIALQGKDVLMRAKTGSGKTLAFCLPLLENLLRNPPNHNNSENTNTNTNTNNTIQALILAPTRELIHQISEVLSTLLLYCDTNCVRYLSLTGIGKYGLKNEKPRIQENPNILICTPARLAYHLKHGSIANLENIEYVIIDEADLLMTHDFEDDMKHIVLNLSNTHRPQFILCSATLNPNTSKLQELLFLNIGNGNANGNDNEGKNGDNNVDGNGNGNGIGNNSNNCQLVEINKQGFDESKLSEYYFRCASFNEKFLILFVLFKLQIIHGKCIIFVHSIDLAYRIKLFLEKFLISTAILNCKLPFNSRQSVIEKFNRGLFKYLITTDDMDAHHKNYNQQYRRFENANANENENDKSEATAAAKEQSDENDKNSKTVVAADTVVGDADGDEDSNGINIEDEYDFGDDNDNDDGNQDVEDNNDDDEDRSRNSDHNINKNAHSMQQLIPYRGVDFREVSAVINFSAPYTIRKYIHRIGRTARAGNFGVAITLVTIREMRHFKKTLDMRESTLNPLPLKLSELEAFRYRCNSVRCSITTGLVKQARLNELRMEILNSKRLQSHFGERKREFELLRHNKMLQSAEMIKPHMAHIPKYMMNGCSLLSSMSGKQRYRYKQYANNANKEFKQMFGKLPPLMLETIRKKKLRRAMAHNPQLKKQVLIRRKFNLTRNNRRPNGNIASMKNWDFLNKSTLMSNSNNSKFGLGHPSNNENSSGRQILTDKKVYIKPVRSWKDPLKKRLVIRGRQNPSYRGLAKKQIKKLRKRNKLKKLARRR